MAGSRVLAALVTVQFAAAGCTAPGVDAKAAAPLQRLRVGTSGDYAPFSRWQPNTPHPTGFDPAVARAFAKDRGFEIEWVRFRWPELLSDLAEGRFDVAMAGITVRPERSIVGRFSVPVASSGAIALVREADGGSQLAALNRPGVEIAVNAGGHLERVARSHFPEARIRAIPDNGRVLQALLGGGADAAITDTLEAPHWLEGHPELRALGPFTRDLKAYLIAPGNEALASDLDRWLLAREADGRLVELRETHLGAASAQATAEPGAALIATIRQRLALMPWVADAKRRGGLAVEVPEREQRVLDAASAAVANAARAQNAPPLEEAAVRAFYVAQIEAAKHLQRETLALPPSPERRPADLDAELRPALIRLGGQLAWLLVQASLDRSERDLQATARQALLASGLPDPLAQPIAASLVRAIRPTAP